jgi:hypothetical protein
MPVDAAASAQAFGDSSPAASAGVGTGRRLLTHPDVVGDATTQAANRAGSRAQERRSQASQRIFEHGNQKGRSDFSRQKGRALQQSQVLACNKSLRAVAGSAMHTATMVAVCMVLIVCVRCTDAYFHAMFWHTTSAVKTFTC